MKRFSPYIYLLIICVACTTPAKKEPLVEQIDHKAALLSFFAKNFEENKRSSIGGAASDSLRWLQRFYLQNKFSPIWIDDSLRLKSDGQGLIELFSKANSYGLDTKPYSLNTLLSLKNELNKKQDPAERYELASKLELLLSYHYMWFGKRMNSGVLEQIDSFTVLPKKEFKLDLSDYLSKAHATDSLLQKLNDLQPGHQQYLNLKKGLVKYLKTSSLSTENINVLNFRDDSIEAVKSAKLALILHRYLEESHNDSLYDLALMKFQKEHGLKQDGLIGRNTAKALSLSPYDYYNKIVCNLERWRWKEQMGTDYLLVNIPSYNLQVFKEGELQSEYRTVVGKKKNQTPEILDTLEFIIAYPYWNVPRKISVEEILGKAQKDSTYLSRNNYEVLSYSREEIDPKTIDWNEIDEESFNFLMRQKGGASNSLGLVKFIFPNKHAIYLHDTPSQYHFSLETRAYSHGCVRVHRALDLAQYLLDNDKNKYNLDSVYSYIKKKKEKPIRLNKKLPIHIYYFTAEADTVGNLTFYNDIYDLDGKLIKELALNRR